MGENLEKDVEQIKEWQYRFEKKFDMVMAALVGNEISKDGGLVADMAILKQKQEKLEKGDLVRQVKLGIVWTGLGALAMYIIVHVLK